MDKPTAPNIPEQYLDMIRRNVWKHLPGKYKLLWANYQAELSRWEQLEMTRKTIEAIHRGEL
jgi:hypothetical protein